MSLEMIAGKPRILEMVEEGVRDERLVIDRDRALEEARALLERLSGFDANLAEFDEDVPPIVVVRGSRFIAYVVVLPPGHIVTSLECVKIIEKLLVYINKIKETNKNFVLIFYSKKGVLTTAAYLYLGSVIENHGIGVLFINGGADEVLEVLWHLENTGKYVPSEDESVDLNLE